MSETPRDEHLNRPMTPAAIALGLLVFALWGANNLAIKVAVGPAGTKAIPPLAAAGIRFSLGLVFVAGWAFHKRVSLVPRRGEWGGLILLALAFTVQIAALNLGQKLTSAVRGTVFLAAHPLFIGLCASFFVPGDRLTRRKLAGLATAFAGIVVTFAEGFHQPGGGLLGDAVVLSSAVMLGGRLVYLKLLTRRIPAPRLLVWQFVLSLPLFFLASAVWESGQWGVLTNRHIAAMLYQGLVVAGLCFAGNAWLYENFRASQIAGYTNTVPVWGVLWCWLLLGEPLTLWVLLGVALVTAGIALASGGTTEEQP
ncbi:MAG: DMT family transporter [Armatimonadetes bacterium]|nr:DMT family transporter [Armatimonadota bacterium]